MIGSREGGSRGQEKNPLHALGKERAGGQGWGCCSKVTDTGHRRGRHSSQEEG